MEIPYNVPPSVTAGSVMRVTVTPTIRLLKLHVNWLGVRLLYLAWAPCMVSAVWLMYDHIGCF